MGLKKDPRIADQQRISSVRRLSEFLCSALECWFQTEKPALRDGESIRRQVSVQILELPWWRTRGGRLILTNQRVLFLPHVARVLPLRSLSPSRIEIKLGVVESVGNKRSFIPFVWDTLRIVSTDGAAWRFSLWDGYDLHQEIVRLIDPLSEAPGSHQD